MALRSQLVAHMGLKGGCYPLCVCGGGGVGEGGGGWKGGGGGKDGEGVGRQRGWKNREAALCSREKWLMAHMGLKGVVLCVCVWGGGGMERGWGGRWVGGAGEGKDGEGVGRRRCAVGRSSLWPTWG